MLVLSLPLALVTVIVLWLFGDWRSLRVVDFDLFVAARNVLVNLAQLGVGIVALFFVVFVILGDFDFLF